MSAQVNQRIYTRPVQISLAVGIVAAVLAVAGLFISGPQLFFQGYLFAFLFWLSLSLGSLALLLLLHVSGNHWGLTIRRVNEASSGTVGLMAILFIPLLLALPVLYPWARPATVAAQPLLQYKSFYLNVPFFIIRAIIYFAVWIFLAAALNRSRGRKETLGGLGLILYGVTMTFAAVDWLMSLEPFWSSTIFGTVIIFSQILTAMSFAILILNLFPNMGLGKDWTYQTTPIPYQDLGAITIVLVMGWAYLAYFQMLIIWAGNLPREVIWYVNRTTGGWQIVAWILAILQFVLPFTMLLSNRVRHSMRVLAWIGGVLLFSNLVNFFWHVKPAFYPGAFAISWLDVVLPVAMGGFWLSAFFFLLQRRPALSEAEQAIVNPKGEQENIQTY
jgi:hypothetical protein